MSALVTSRKAALKVGLPVSRYLAEVLVLGRFPVIRMALRRLLWRQLQQLETLIDRNFYLRQIDSPSAKVLATRDPALHYALIGRFRSYAPNADFDPAFYRAEHPDLGWAADPVGHFARSGTTGRAHEVAALKPLHPIKPGAGAVLTIHHGRGGGSSQFLRRYEEALCAGGERVIRLSRVSMLQPLFRAFDRQSGEPLGAAFHLIEDRQRLAELVRHRQVGRIVINHVIDLPLTDIAAIPDIVAGLGIPFEIILHDYFVLCPRVYMVDGSGRFCDGAPVAVCRPCLARGGSEAGQVDPASWRQTMQSLVRKAGRVIVPSGDVAQRLARHLPGLTIDVWNPEDDAALQPAALPSIAAGEPLKVAVIGAINVAKGFDVIERLSRHVARQNLPIHLVLIGHSIDDPALRKQGVAVTGRYRASDIDRLLQTHAPQVVLQPAIWPETWSFTTSAALRHRIPVCAFDIGAVAQRLERLEGHRILPLALADHPDRLAAELLSMCSRKAVSPCVPARVA